MSTQNLTLGDILKKAENNTGGIGISAEDIRVATAQLIGEENKEYLPYGQLITDGKSFDDCNDSLKEALASGNDVEGSVLCAIVGRDVVVTESGKKALVGSFIVLANTDKEAVVIRTEIGENYMTLAQLESLKQALDAAKEKLIELKPSLSNYFL